MGVYTEPAHRADDAGRLVPGMIRDAAGAGRPKAASARSLPVGLRRCILGTVLAGLALGASLPAVRAHDGAATLQRTQQGALQGVGEASVRSDLRAGDRPVEWDNTALQAGEAATRTVYDAHPATAPTPRSDAESLVFGSMRVPRGLVETILRAAEATGVDPIYMMALADKESSFDTDVKASTSSAQGLFQFVTGTWLEMIRDYGARHGLAEEAAAVKSRGGIGVADPAMRKRILGLRNDPYVAGLMAGELINRDRARIEARIGRSLKRPELYLAHFLGTSDAGRLLEISAQNPDRNAQQAFGSAARANRSIFTERDGRKRRSLTVGEVHERLGGMIDKRLDRYQAVSALAEPEDIEHPEETVLDARLRLRQDILPPAVAPIVR